MFAESLVLFGGKGGAGKTTCAAAAALEEALARPGRRVRLVSTDPAHSLQDSLAGLPLPANLEVLELDAAGAYAAFRDRHGGVLREIARRGTFFDDQDISRLLALSLPGLDELMALLEIARLATDDTLLVCDTAPTGHTLRLLEMPGLMRGWIAALEALLAKHRYLRATWGRRDGADEPDRFVAELSEQVEGLAGRLRGGGCRFVPVTLAEPLSVRETADLLERLAGLRIAAPEVVVNRLRPAAGCAGCAAQRATQERALEELRGRPGIRLLGLPLRAAEVRGAALLDFWSARFPVLESGAGAPAAPAAPPIEARFEEPPASARLLIFGGKGGVGKTTLACAAALRLARPCRRVLLISADPAHSVADCLGLPLGPAPVATGPSLDAMEIDAAREWEAFRGQYGRDVAAFLERLPESLDLPFDRPVLERLLELSPPGMDEIMALARVMDLLATGRYDLLVLDTAASGHLVRLLELPALAQNWVRAIFEILLKYRKVLRLPRFSERLVEFSRNLKRLHGMLRDPARCRLYLVATPSRLALEETRDLAAACERLGIQPAALLLNRLTPPGACRLCRALVEEEEAVREEFRGAFPQFAPRQGEEACAAN